MKYRLLLRNTANGDEAEIIVPDHLPLEDLSVKAKLELGLPLCDDGWHRFLSHGTTYVVDEHLCAEPEIRFEYDLPVGRYRSSERIRLKHVFTVLDSAVTYLQDDHFYSDYKVRITLRERI